jgi:hypothetical protein
MLPPDARFCHKCGKPQVELLETELETEPVLPPAPVMAAPAAAAVPAEINFHNPIAVRTAMVTGMLATLLSSLPLPPPLLWPILALMIAGALAVFLYMKRTGTRLSVRAGARMGWLTGIFAFAMIAVLFTMLMVFIANNGGFSAFYRESMKGMVTNSVELERALRDLESPGTLAGVLMATLAALFFLFTTFPMLGGALGAKLLARDDS